MDTTTMTAKEMHPMTSRTSRASRHPRMRRWALGLAVTCLAGLAFAVPAQAAEFEIAEFDGSTPNQDGTPSVQAGAHPYEVDTSIKFNSITNVNNETVPVEQVRDTSVELPVGVIGNPTSVPRCREADFENFSCPVSSQVGIATISGPGTFLGAGIFNLIPAAGQAAQFGLNVGFETVHLDAHVRSASDYGVTVDVPNTPQAIQLISTTVDFWGVPADPSHDALRGPALFCFADPNVPGNCQGGGNPAGVPPAPFLSNPTRCSAEPLETDLSVDSWTNPGVFKTSSFVAHDAATPPNPVLQSGCDRLPFTPSISAKPTSGEAESPTGLDVHVQMPQEGLLNAAGLAEADLKKAVVTLPEGMAVNPSSANGLGICSNSQIGFDAQSGHFSADPAACPDNSRLGAVEITTPLLDHSVQGGVYLAKQGENKFGSLLAIYLAVDDPQTGVVIKLPGLIAPDPKTGRLVATFDENPQLPFEDLHVEFFGGPRASLINPSACGTYQTSGEFTPWSGTPPVTSTSYFQITQGPTGKACPNGGFDPRLTAGTSNPVAGSYSPFRLNVSREDGTQQLSAISAKLPKGLVGKLAGIPYCPDAALAGIPTAEGTGATQLASPSCPAASQVGTVTVGAGAGPSPFFVDTGKAYLAGPYKGAPLSMAFVTPAIAGPFDLGNVVVRAALRINPETTQITADSDPLPTILDGIPLDLRSVQIEIGRPDFTLNPTDCQAMSVTTLITSPAGKAATPSSPFQVGNCEALGFGPKLKIQLTGATKRIGHPGLKAVLTAGPGEANIGRAQVNLPHGEFLDQGNLNKTCTKPVLLEGKCPATAVYGRARAWTPLLAQPLEGNVYLVGGYGYKLPALVAELNGQIKVLLVGKVDSGSNKGIRNTFEMVPDAPVSRFELVMKGGKKYGLLENSENLCKASKQKRQANVVLSGQNGKVDQFKSVVANQCGKTKTQPKKKSSKQ
jgi:hypothetical protein